MVTDVTEAFRTLQAVRDQKEMLDLAARVSGLGHWVWDPEQFCLAFCSDHLARMFDVDASIILSRVTHPSEFSSFVAESDRSTYQETVSNGLANAEEYDIEYRRDSPIGLRHFREIGQPLVDDDGNLQRYFATVQDITETKAHEAKLEDARRELEVLVEAKDQLFSIIGHDLKSPFNNIIGFASLLSSYNIALAPGKVQEYATLILEAAENTNTLLDTLLAWAAVESAELPFRPLDMSMGEAFTDSIRPLATLAREKGVTVETTFNNMRVRADRDMVLTVFRNLINNAIKFCEAGDRIMVSATPREDSPDYVHITVTDTGVGMDADKVCAVLDGRRLQPAAGTSGETGTGLGLRICHNLVRRHGGDLWAESDRGKGCDVHFTLPAG